MRFACRVVPAWLGGPPPTLALAVARLFHLHFHRVLSEERPASALSSRKLWIVRVPTDEE